MSILYRRPIGDAKKSSGRPKRGSLGEKPQRTDRIMYFATRSASFLVLALTRLWTLNPRLVHASLGHQEVEVRVKIDPVPKCLNDRNNSGHMLAPGYNPEITGQGPEGQATELPEELALVLKEDPKHHGDGEDEEAVLLVEAALVFGQ
jgi:hypothetical protein